MGTLPLGSVYFHYSTIRAMRTMTLMFIQLAGWQVLNSVDPFLLLSSSTMCPSRWWRMMVVVM